MKLHVEIDSDTRLLYQGDDLDFYVAEDGTLSVFNYDLRKSRVGCSGLILSAAKGSWRYVREIDSAE